MLVHLHVKNLALIEEADINFFDGLNIMTGETGAGKSIILGSVNIALGGKVTADIIRKGAEYALTELAFHIDDKKKIAALKDMDIEELLELRSLIENTYSEIDEDYNEFVDKITELMKLIKIEWMLDFTLTDSDFYNFIVYDLDTRTNELIQENLDAYDENLDTCVEEEMNKARKEYLDMKSDLEEGIFYLMKQIKLVVVFLEKVHQKTLKYSNKWITQKVDNT